MRDTIRNLIGPLKLRRRESGFPDQSFKYKPLRKNEEAAGL